MTDRDTELVEFISDLTVDERDEGNSVKLTVELDANPIISSEVLWVQVSQDFTRSGIEFQPGYSLACLDDVATVSRRSFFSLFAEEDLTTPWTAAEAAELVQWIETDIWEDPFKYA